MLLILSLIFGAVSPSAHAVASGIAPLPVEFVRISNSIKSESSRAKRLELLLALQTLTKKRVSEIPQDIGEKEVPAAEVLFELELFLNNLRVEHLNPADCSRTQTAIHSWANPLNEAPEAMNPTGRFVLDIVKSVCRE